METREASVIKRTIFSRNINEVIKQNRIRAVELTGLQRLGHRLDKDEEEFLDQQSEIREQREEDEEEFEQEVKEFMIEYSKTDPMRYTMESSLDSSSSDEILRALRGSYGSLSSSYT